MQFFTFTLEKTLLFYKGGEFITDSAWHHRSMRHKGDYELIVCIRGPIYIEVEGQQFTIEKGEAFIVPPFSEFFGYKDSPEGADFYWVHFFSQFKERSFTANVEELASELRNKKSTHHQISLPIHFKLNDDRQVMVLIHQILSTRDEISYIEERDFLCSAMMVRIFKLFLNAYEPNEEQTKINYLKEWIRANISCQLTVQQIADRVHLNPDYLTRLFKKYTGMTTLQYINHLKIEVASLLLVRTELPIKQIADYAYFSDDKTFMRRFKHETGLTPSEYRNSYNRIHLNNPHVDPQIPIPKRIADSIDYIPENGDIPE
ncbi:AraC family transcriptional regulator [Lentilactobacillus sp. Marseille-Q4993]|uniref:AraC family transcriptional regulator n=1 Tax=Lentilactobacillus sp. Marseille-Q4993 TaxID=3039492 RepID=UPI0024BC1A73|nr:AraC family transcriptional regulator [Lentilactobacillus sp. Marseille-Q4993]